MPLATADVDHIARLQDTSCLPTRAHAAATRDAVEELAAWMLVPMRACARREVDDPDVRAVLALERGSQPHLSSESPVIASFERPVTRR